MEFTKEELESADLLLVIDSEGRYRWSSHRSLEQVASVLGQIAEEVRQQNKRKMAEAIERGDWGD